MSTLALPASKRRKLFRAIVLRLQQNPNLKRVVRTWQTWEGGTTDATVGPDGGPTPWLRITPESKDAFKLSERTTQSPFLIKIEFAHQSHDADDPMDFWESALVPALFPADSTMAQLLTANGALRYMALTQPAIGPQTFGQAENSNVYMTAVGILELDMLVITRL
jgi:hypothetical protein